MEGSLKKKKWHFLFALVNFSDMESFIKEGGS